MGGLYDARWQRRRVQQLREEPLCRLCLSLGRIMPASVADHITPHRGDPVLFDGPLQSLCKRCHDSIKQQQEKSGTFRGCDANGLPLDPSHEWRR